MFPQNRKNFLVSLQQVGYSKTTPKETCMLIGAER